MSQGGNEVRSVNMREVVECRDDKEISRERLLKLITPIAEEASVDPGDTLTISISSGNIEIVVVDEFDNSSKPAELRTIRQVLNVTDKSFIKTRWKFTDETE